MESPADDYVVVERDEEGDEHCTESHSWGLVHRLIYVYLICFRKPAVPLNMGLILQTDIGP